MLKWEKIFSTHSAFQLLHPLKTWFKEEGTGTAPGCACLCCQTKRFTFKLPHIHFLSHTGTFLCTDDQYTKQSSPVPPCTVKQSCHLTTPQSLPILCSYLLWPIQVSSIHSCVFNNDFLREIHLLFSPCPKRCKINQHLCESPM